MIDERPNTPWLRVLPWAAAPLAILASLLLGFGAHAQAPNSEDVADGMRLYRQKGECQASHGWAATKLMRGSRNEVTSFLLRRPLAMQT